MFFRTASSSLLLFFALVSATLSATLSVGCDQEAVVAPKVGDALREIYIALDGQHVGDFELVVDETDQLQAMGISEAGERDVTDKVVWETDLPTIATVSSGQVTALAPGSVVVAASLGLLATSTQLRVRRGTSDLQATIEEAPPTLTNQTQGQVVFGCNQIDCTLECAFDSTLFSPCTSPQTYDGLADGTHHFQVRPIDPSSVAAAPVTSTQWTVDTHAPLTTFSQTPFDVTPQTTATFAFGCDEDTCTFACALDDVAQGVCQSPVDKVVDFGAHTFSVVATDGAGNQGNPATFVWTVACDIDSECGGEQLCLQQSCVPGDCRENSDCAGQVCTDNFCAPCTVDDQCGVGRICASSGLCGQNQYGDGIDGPGVVAAGTTINLATSSISGRATPDAAAFRVLAIDAASLTLSSQPGAALQPGDEVLIIALRGTQIRNADLAQVVLFHENVGNWEMQTVVSVAAKIVTLSGDVQKVYGQDDNSVVNGERIVGLFRVPHYTSLTVEDGAKLTTRLFQPQIGRPQRNNDINANAMGGALFLRVSGEMVVAANASVDVTGLGYRGGQKNSGTGEDGQAGEGTAGFGVEGCLCNNQYNEGRAPFFDNAGGGGAFITGAGGGYGSAGGSGDFWSDPVTVASEGGQVYGDPQLLALHFGGGGGGEYNNNGCGPSGDGPGGNGGGVLAIWARTLDNAGTLVADGGAGLFGARAFNSFGVGGGAGGSLLLIVDAATLSGTVSAQGAVGFDPADYGCGGTNPMPARKGGAGGQGRVRFDYASLNGAAFGSDDAATAVSAAFTPVPGALGNSSGE